MEVTLFPYRIELTLGSRSLTLRGLDMLSVNSTSRRSPIPGVLPSWWVDITVTPEVASGLPEWAPRYPGMPANVITLDLRPGVITNQPTWANSTKGAQDAQAAIQPIVRAAPTGGGGGGQVDSVVAGDAIAVDATDPANPIVDVLVDGVTIGFNGSNQLEVPAGGGGYVPVARTINTTAPLTGGGNLSANRTFAVSDFTNGARGTVPASGGGTTNFLRADQTWAAPPAGTVTNVSASSPLASSGGATPNITASTSNGGLGAADSGKLLVFGAQGQFAASSLNATALDVLASGSGGAIIASANTGITVSLENVGGATTLYTESNAPANPPLHANNLHATGPIAFFHGAGGALGMELGSDGGAAWTSATGAQTTATNLPAFGTATKGVVPASGGGTSNFLRADGTFAAPAGTAGITSLTGGVTATGPGAAAATVVTNANLTGPITSVGNATSIASQTGTGTTFAMSAGPTFTGVPAATTAAASTNTTQIATTAFVQQELALQNPSFLTYSGGSQVYAVTTLAAVNSTTFTFPSTGFYHVQYTITHDANATTTGANFGVAGTAAFDYLDIVVVYRVDASTAGRSAFSLNTFSSAGGTGLPAQSSNATTNNKVSVDVWINVTTVGDVSLLAASEVAVANGITVTAVTGFMKKESN